MTSFEILQIILGSVVAVCTVVGAWFGMHKWSYQQKQKQIAERRTQYRDDLSSHLQANKDLIDGLKENNQNHQSFNEQMFSSIKTDSSKLEKRVSILESRLVTEDRVDSKLSPIIQDVEETKTAIRDLRDELRGPIHQMTADMSEIKGYLKAKSENGSV